MTSGGSRPQVVEDHLAFVEGGGREDSNSEWDGMHLVCQW